MACQIFTVTVVIIFNESYLIEKCALIVELSQFYSEKLECHLNKKNEFKFELDFSLLQKGFQYEGKIINFFDDEDWYRIDYFKRKQQYPVNLYYTLREGMVDDFFGVWNNDNCAGDLFNECENIQIIFNMP